jgi:RNA polymerase sigma factor (sigma-70 family)
VTFAANDGCDPKQAEESFILFFTEHRSDALVLLRLTLAGTGIDPEDVASAMWTRVWQTWRRRGPWVEAPKAFIRQSARHAAADALRANRELSLDYEGLEAAAAKAEMSRGASEFTPEKSICPLEGIGDQHSISDPRLIAAIHCLTPTERLVMIALVETNPPPTSQQIAHMLGISSAATVRVHKRRAIDKLRRIFEAQEVKEGD